MTQEQSIFNYLKEGNHLTPIGALNMFGCLRLAARIHSLRQTHADVNIVSGTVKRPDGKAYAKYYIKSA